jgi:GAF domain-containing protein
MDLPDEFAPADPEAVADAVSLLNAALGTPMAMASHIDGETYTLVGVDDRLDAGLTVGTEFETSETFCHCVYEGPDSVEVIPDIAQDDRVAGLPAHAELGLSSYLGVPLFRDGAFYGTLVACDTTPRSFTEEAVGHARTVARLVESAL